MVGGIRYISFLRHNFLNAEVGYELAPALWGQGIIAEALNAITDFGFMRVGLNRIHVSIHPDNIASRRVAAKVGFQEDGGTMRLWEYNERTQLWADRVLSSLTHSDGVHVTQWQI